MQIVIVIALMTLAAFGQTQSTRQVRELQPGETFEREMTGAETHRYRFDLRANEFFQARAEQKGIDVMLRLLDANGAELARMDSPNGKQGQETLSFVADKSGSFVLEVTGTDAKAGKGNYSIRREASRMATAQDRKRVETERVFVEGVATSISELQTALLMWQEGQKLANESRSNSIAARSKLNEALAKYRAFNTKINDKAFIEIISQSGELSQQSPDFLTFLRFQSKLGEAMLLNEIANTHFNLNEWQESVDYSKLAVAVCQEIIVDKTFLDRKESLVQMKLAEALWLMRIGQTLDGKLDQPEEGLKCLNQAIECYRALYQEKQDPKFKLQEALALSLTGQIYGRESIGKRKAIDFVSKAIEIYRAFPDQKANVADGLGLIGAYHLSSYEFDEALKNWDEALETHREIGDKLGQCTVLQSIAAMYFILNNKAKVRENINKTLLILQSPDYAASWKNRYAGTRSSASFDEMFEAVIERLRLRDIGRAYEYLEDYQKAIEYYEKSLVISRNQKISSDIRRDLGDIGFAYSKLEKWDKAFEYYSQAMAISRAGNVREDIADGLADVGEALLETGKPQEALKYQNEALAVYQSVGIDGKTAFSPKYSSLLNELARSYDALGNRRLAIFYGKRGVNAIQGERLRLQNLDPVAQKGFLENKQKHYRRLADWLIAEGRIAEAEQVLALFKQDEYLDSLGLDKKLAALKKLEALQNQSLDKILLTDTERDASMRYEEIASELASAGKERDALDKKSKNFEAGKFPDQARLDQLNKKFADAQNTFDKFLEELDTLFRNPVQSRTNPPSYTRTLLRRLNQPRTVIISTIVSPDRLNLIVTTARTYRAYSVEIKAADLNKLVLEFREAVKDRNSDPRAAGKKLYDALFPAGLQKDLASIRADKIVWSLDGTLRYAPIAALWDGKRYLVEKYANSVITLASRGKLNQPVRRRATWTALGVGVSQEGKVKDIDGTELDFVALPAVKEELCSVVNDPRKKRFCADLKNVRAGILEGRNLSDEEFTLESLKLNLGRYPVVHIASHFRLNPGNEYTSYLLLGDKDIEKRKLTLAAVRDTLGNKLDGVEVLALSACNTAMSAGEKSNGVEIESFGAMAQNLGARSVLATLWPVADSSTRDLMIEFYREMKINPRTGKAEALRKAQLTLLRGRNRAGEIPMMNRDLKLGKIKGERLPQIKHKEDAQFAHPYYWSPFVLMGDWR